MPKEVKNITMQPIISLEGNTDGILIGESPKFFLVTLVKYKIFVVVGSVLFGLSLSPLS